MTPFSFDVCMDDPEMMIINVGTSLDKAYPISLVSWITLAGRYQLGLAGTINVGCSTRCRQTKNLVVVGS